eukprot:gene13873-19799_t
MPVSRRLSQEQKAGDSKGLRPDNTSTFLMDLVATATTTTRESLDAYEVCPFCCKVKAVMDFYEIPYKVIEVNPLTKSELKWSTYKKTIQQQDKEQVRLLPDEVGRESTGVTRVSCNVRSWLEISSLWIPAVTKGCGGVRGESWDTFKYITEKTNWSWGTRELARISGAVIMWQEYMDAIGPTRNFLGGDVPNLADLAMYGVLSAIKKAPTYGDLMENSPRMAAWYLKVDELAGSSARTSTEGSKWRVEQ